MPKNSDDPVISDGGFVGNGEYGNQGLWTHIGDKFTIGTIHGELVQIEAQYNPKELAFTASASWGQLPKTNGGKAKGRTSYKMLEYSGTESRTLTIELLFDGFEERISVQPEVDKLEGMTTPVDPNSSRSSDRRPQLCVAIWGKGRPFRCVVTSVATKLTMFHQDGRPLRAICTVTLKECDAVAMLHNEDEVEFAEINTRARSQSWKDLLPEVVRDVVE